MDIWCHIPEKCSLAGMVRVCARWREATSSVLVFPTTNIQNALPVVSCLLFL